MNYREFTERVYNYKHGLTNSAESQNIEHSAKQTEETNENEHIEHSGQGQTWDQHKYIRKEYLGNGNWRYIYEDGSSNVTNAANEKEADVKEGAYQANKAYGNGAQNTNYQTGAAAKMSSNTEFTQARKDMYKELGEKAADHNKQLENFQGMAKGLAQSNADQEASKLKIQAGNIADNLGASQKETADRKMYVDLANKARDYNKQLEGFQGVTKSLEQSNADQAESARQLEKEALAAKAQARSDRFDKMANLDVNTSATPLNQLTNQGVAATQEANRVTENNAKNEAAKSALDGYTSQLRDVYYDLNNAGLSDDEIMNLIRTAEKMKMGESIIDQINGYDPKKQNMVFMAGAEEAFNGYTDKVIPVLKAFTSSYEQTGSANLNSANAVANPDPNAKPEPVDLSKYDSDVKAFGETYGQTAADVMQAYKNGGIDAAVNTYLDSDWAQGFKEAARTIANERGLSDDEIFDINTYKNFYGNAIPDDWFSKIYYPASAARQYMSGDEYDKFADQIEKILRTIVNNQGVNDYYKNK